VILAAIAGGLSGGLLIWGPVVRAALFALALVPGLAERPWQRVLANGVLAGGGPIRGSGGGA